MTAAARLKSADAALRGVEAHNDTQETAAAVAHHETEVNDLPLGRRVQLKDFHADLKLLNPNDYALDFRVIPVAFWESAIAMPPGMIAAWDPKWLIVAKEHVKAKSESFTPIDLSVKIPDDPRLRGKTIILIVRAEILQQEIPAYAYGEVVVRTAK